MISGTKIKKQNFGPQAVLIGLFISKTGIAIKFWTMFNQNLNTQNFGVREDLIKATFTCMVGWRGDSTT